MFQLNKMLIANNESQKVRSPFWLLNCWLTKLVIATWTLSSLINVIIILMMIMKRYLQFANPFIADNSTDRSIWNRTTRDEANLSDLFEIQLLMAELKKLFHSLLRKKAHSKLNVVSIINHIFGVGNYWGQT